MNITPEHAADLEQLKRALAALKKMRAKLDAIEQAQNEPVAIVGIGCRVPGGANSPQAFWTLLKDGVDAIVEVPSDRWNASAFYDPDPTTPGKMQTKYGGFIKDIDKFDPYFFGIAPREAAAMDPQQRLILEVVWEALEDAGQIPAHLAGSQVGVFIGIGLNDYGRLQVPGQVLDPALADTYALSGNILCITANRLSYMHDFHGPSMAVDTACSSSLTAVHLACQSLRSGESPLALAGGVNVMLSPEFALTLAKFLSPDGRCKTFDARADGYARGEGAVVVVLKLLSKALADGDSIYAVIRGSAVNQDGYSSGLTVPNGVAQQMLLRAALKDAGVRPEQVSYVEAHGTGTSLGDPIEANALGTVFGNGRPAGDSLAIGSVKTNIGHLEAAAGIAGLVKVALALKYGQIPPSLHYQTPNPHIPFEDLSLRVQHTLTPWPKHDGPVLAGVSSFGFGGSNAHVILEAAPARHIEPLGVDRPAHVLTLSGKSSAALEEQARRYADYLAAQPEVSLADICYSATTGRSHFDHRLAVVAETTPEMHDKLAAVAAGSQPDGVFSGQVQRTAHPKTVFLFTGQGSQYVGMGRQLYDTQPTFRASLERCADLLRPHLERPLLSVLYPEAGSASPLDETAYTQPALFALEYALAELWRSWGIEPAAVMGHSVGEYVAACIAGVFSLEDGLRLIAERGRLMQSLPPGGGMAAVLADEARVAAAIAPYSQSVSIAAVNGPDNVVISGAGAALDAALDNLKAEGVKVRRLTVSHAFHSPLMEPALPAFEQVARQVRYNAPRIPLVANLTGQFWQPGQAPEAGYWTRHLREAVRFSAAVEMLHSHGYATFLEIGPSPTLLGMAKRCLPDDEAGLWLPSLRPGHDDWRQALKSLATLYTQGATINWAGFERDYVQGRRHVSLPTYPFQRERYWFTSGSRRATHAPKDGREKGIHPLLGHPLRSPALKGMSFEAQLDGAWPPFLTDHRVYGTMVFPATAYLEMALAAATRAFGPGQHTIEELVIQEALLLSESENEARTVQLMLTPEDADCAAFRIFSHINIDETDAVERIDEWHSAPAWQLHGEGRIRRGPKGADISAETTTSAPEQPSLNSAQDRCQDEMPVPFYYQRLRELGMEYGPGFRGIERLWRQDGEALGQVALPATLKPEASDYQIHPALLDACVQVLAAASPLVQDSDNEASIYLPIGLDHCCFYRRPDRQLWSYASIRPNADLAADTLTGDIRLFDITGQIVAEIEGVHLKRASRAALLRAARPKVVAESSPADWYYEVVWQPQAYAESPAAVPAGQPGHWLILADRQGIGAALAERLAEQGESCTLVFAGDGYDSAGEGQWTVDPAHPEDYHRLLRESLTAHAQPYRGIVHLWSLETPSQVTAAAELRRAQALTCGSALYLVQALAKVTADFKLASGESARGQSPRLWLVTRGAQPAEAGALPLTIAQAPLWGLGRTLALEQPELRCKCIDLDPSVEATNNQALFAEVWSGDEEDQVAFRASGRYVARLVPSAVKAQPDEESHPAPDTQPVRLEISARGALDNLVLQPMVRRQPAPGEVEIRVQATGLNFRDVLSALDMYPGDGGALGHECTGTIMAVGEGVTNFKVGDEVIAVAQGSFSTFVIAEADLVIHKPDQFSFAEAATIPIAFLTAHYALNHLAQLKPGERVLIHAAAGGVGMAAVQLAQKVGAEIFATAGNPEKRAFLKMLGVQHVMDSRSLDFADEVMALTDGQGVDVVLNSLADEFIPKSLSVLKKEGRFLEIGKRGIWDQNQVAQLGRDIAYFVIYLGEVCQQNPALVQSMLRDLMVDFRAGRLKPLPLSVYPLPHVVDAFRTMAQAKHIGKIVVSQEAKTAADAGQMVTPFRADGTYLITGGLSGLGLLVAQRIVERGGRHLVLVGRRPPSAAAHETLRRLEQAGAQVIVASADVSREEEVARVLADIDRSMPPLYGIVHAAGVLDDGVLSQQDWERFVRVMAPKIDGSWHLHQMTLNKALDFFVLFSAGAALIGSAGQGNYTAANAFLDALAYQRRAQGLPALSINWGPWGEVGMAAGLNSQSQRRWAEQGLGTIPPEQGLQALEQLLQQDNPQVAVLPMDWSAFGRRFSPGHLPSLFVDLIQAAPAQAQDEPAPAQEPELLRRLAEAPPGNRRSLIMAHVREQAGKVLGLASARAVSPQQPLSELGLDSLMAVELRNILGSSIQATLPATLLFDYPTLEALTDYLAKDVLSLDVAGKPEPPPGTPPKSQAEQSQAAAIAELEKLSDAEAEALLLAELASAKKGD